MRAKSNFTLSLVAAALVLPGPALALGLGRLTVDSALGQPLQARIELTSASRDELDTLSAKVADPSLYRQNNLAYQGALSRTRITLERTADGNAFLRVSSPTAINEPYLDLLVEVNWASGRVVRDYTFLLDPPGIAIAAAVEPATPARVGASAPRTQQQAPTTAAAAPRPAGEGYTVKRGDTLSKIASEVKPAEVTLDQMLVALFKSNANAFDGNNMNRLRTGAIMTIPSAEEATSTAAPEATKVVKVQASDWRGYRDRVAGAAPEAQGAGGRAAAGAIGTAVEEKAPAAAAGRDQLRVTRDAAGKGTGAAEEAVARDKQLREAQARITELERTLKDLQRAVELKSGTMAQLQTQADTAKGKAPPPAPITTPPAPVVTTPITKAPEPVKAPEPLKAPEPPKVAEPMKAPELPKAAEPVKVPEPPKAAEPVKAPDTKAAEPPKAVEPPKVAEAPKLAEAPKTTPPKAPVKAKAEPSFFDDLTAGLPTWAIGGGALLVLGLIAALIASRRRKTTKFEDSIISGTDIKTNTVFGSTGGGVVNTGDNSLASDFSREGLGNIDTDEVDPIAEAEVYLAYGRDAQAEEILKDALKKDPQRQEIYLKLLEIHAQHNKPSAFETVASELYSQCQGQGEVWQKAVALGRQLDPNNPMFAEGGSPSSSAAPMVSRGAQGPDSDMFTVGPELTLPPKNLGGGLDMQIDEEITVSPSSGAKPKTPADILAGAEHVLEQSARSSVDASVDKVKAAAATGGFSNMAAMTPTSYGDRSAATPPAAKMDLDFHLDDADKPAPMRQERVEPAFAHSAATPESSSGSSAADKLARPAAALELDKLDLSFDPDKATFEDPTPSVLDGQWHDAATKLDLAKAYQEMGDVEGAREILQEVLHEGDDQQKSEAQALMAKLG